MAIKIGQITLGNVPVVVGTLAGVLSPSVHLEKIDVFEARIDMFDKQDKPYVLNSLELLKRNFKKPLIATFRVQKEGGHVKINDQKRYEILKDVIPLVDAVDIELSSIKLIERILPLYKDKGKLLLSSYHNLDETPGENVLEEIVLNSKRIGADITKIAVKANNKDDLCNLMEFTIKNRKENIITISLGSIGSISRIVNPILGSVMTYGYIDKPASPGQISVFDIIEYLKLFDPAYKSELITKHKILESA